MGECHSGGHLREGRGMGECHSGGHLREGRGMGECHSGGHLREDRGMGEFAVVLTEGGHWHGRVSQWWSLEG